MEIALFASLLDKIVNPDVRKAIPGIPVRLKLTFSVLVLSCDRYDPCSDSFGLDNVTGCDIMLLSVVR